MHSHMTDADNLLIYLMCTINSEIFLKTSSLHGQS